MLNQGILNIGAVGGCLAKAYKTSKYTYVTILQDTKGSLRSVVVDDGLEIVQYERTLGKMRKQRSAGVVQRGFKP